MQKYATVQKNLRAVRKLIGERHFYLPVKANAYGHGLCEIGKIAQNEGACKAGAVIHRCLEEERGF